MIGALLIVLPTGSHSSITASEPIANTPIQIAAITCREMFNGSLSNDGLYCMNTRIVIHYTTIHNYSTCLSLIGIAMNYRKIPTCALVASKEELEQYESTVKRITKEYMEQYGILTVTLYRK